MADEDDAAETEAEARPADMPAAWLRRLVTEEGERLPVRDLTARSRRVQAVGRLLEPATRRLLGRRGLTLAPLLAHWEAVLGPALAGQCVPLRLVRPRGAGRSAGGDATTAPGGTLHVRAASGAVATELTHRAPLLCERINTHLGFRAVDALKVTQGPVRGAAARRPARRRGRALPPPPPSPEAEAALEARLATVEDPELRAALDRLGRAVLRPRR